MHTVILYIGRFSGSGGLTDAALGYVDAIKAAGIPVVLCDYISGNQVGPHVPGVGFSKLGGRSIFQSAPNTRIVTIFHDVPNELCNIDYEGAVHLVAFTVNETLEYPDFWTLPLMDAHSVWTASSYNLENITDTIPAFMVRRFPHCYTHGFSEFARSYFARQIRNEGTPARFFTVCSQLERRQLKRFAEAFLRLREKGHELTFTIKTRKGTRDSISNALGDIEPYSDFLRIDAFDLDRTAIYEYFSSFDAFINTEWGRGWDLPGFCSLALGKIYVSPSAGGNMDFMDNDNTVEIPIDFHEYLDNAMIENKRLYTGCKGAFSTTESIVAAIDKALYKIPESNSCVPESMLSRYSPETVGEMIKRRIYELEDYDFYNSSAPFVFVHYKDAKRSNLRMRPKRRLSGPFPMKVSSALRRWPLVHDSARYVYRRLRG